MVPPTVDSWFRNIVSVNKNSRKNNNTKDDFIQYLLNAGEKLGMILNLSSLKNGVKKVKNVINSRPFLFGHI